jgi:hypothetical protein
MHLKVQTHNLVAKTHTVKAGTFPVAVFSEHAQGLYVERAFVGHPSIKYWQAHILPELHLQICRFTPHAGVHELEYYIDIIKVEKDGHIWNVKDLYLDLGIGWDGKLRIMDTDELFEAVEAGLISLSEASLASQTLHGLVNQISTFGSLEGALQAKGLRLEWVTQTATLMV